MSELALYARRSADAADLIVVYGEYTSTAGRLHILGYVGGRHRRGLWRSERVLIERASDESVALVTEMGDWSAGRTLVRRSSQDEYGFADRSISGAIDSGVDDRVYECVSRWVYWEKGVLRLKPEVESGRFASGSAEVGPVDAGIVSELHSIWELSATNPNGFSTPPREVRGPSDGRS